MSPSGSSATSVAAHRQCDTGQKRPLVEQLLAPKLRVRHERDRWRDLARPQAAHARVGDVDAQHALPLRAEARLVLEHRAVQIHRQEHVGAGGMARAELTE
jgi:hypothetical protein